MLTLVPYHNKKCRVFVTLSTQGPAFFYVSCVVFVLFVCTWVEVTLKLLLIAATNFSDFSEKPIIAKLSTRIMYKFRLIRTVYLQKNAKISTRQMY